MVKSIGYILVHDFSNKENITFVLLKVTPQVKDQRETCREWSDERESSLFSTTPTWNYFQDVVQEQYYPMGRYEDKYIQWTTLRQQRDQGVHELTNLFHTLCTNLGIKYSEKHMVLNYHSFFHKYIQEEMEFLDISSLGEAYRYASKVK